MKAPAARDIAARFGSAFALMLGFASLLVFSVPALLYAGNINEFGSPLLALLAPTWLPALAVALVFALLSAVLPARLHLRLMVLVAALCLLVWLQGTMLLWEYGVFDGRRDMLGLLKDRLLRPR